MALDRLDTMVFFAYRLSDIKADPTNPERQSKTAMVFPSS